MNVEDLFADLRRKLQSIEDRIRSHPFLDLVEAGRVSRGTLRSFCVQQYYIITSDYRSIAYALHRTADATERSYLATLLGGEQSALEALALFGTALGVDADQAFESVPLPGAFAYTACVCWLCTYASVPELAAAFTFNLDAWGANCRRMAEALVDQYGFAPEQTAFFWLFADAATLVESGRTVVQRGLDRGIPAVAFERAATLLQAYELMYWDALYADARGGENS